MYLYSIFSKTNKMKSFLITSMLLLCFCSSGCGYTSKSLLPDELNSIYVDNFKNEISATREVSNVRPTYLYVPGIENTITRAVIDGFIFDRHLDVTRQNDAALVLEGALVDMRQYPLSYTDNYNVIEYRLEIFVDIALYNNLTGDLMWREDRFMGQSNYTVSGPNRLTEAQARTKAVNDLAQRVVERVVEYW